MTSLQHKFLKPKHTKTYRNKTYINSKTHTLQNVQKWHMKVQQNLQVLTIFDLSSSHTSILNKKHSQRVERNMHMQIVMLQF